MKAAFLQAPRHIQLQDVPTPEPGVGEVRIKLKQIGICGSDVHLFLGHRLLDNPTIIGHEGLGYIDKLGPGVLGRQVGERVVVEPNIPCRQCRYCWAGKGHICINKRVVGLNEPGCFAEYIVLPADFCWAVPDTISNDDAVTIEPMAVALHALLTSNAKPGDTIAVIGLGAIGLLITHLALSLGYKVFVTEISPAKVKLAEDLGATALCPTGDAETQITAVAETWLANDVCAVFECAGVAATASLATAAAPRGSEIVLVGLSGNMATFKPLKIAREGIHIVPSIIYDHPFDFRRTLQLMAARIIRPGFIISRQVALTDLQSALELAAQGEHSKIVVRL
ncbi:zinc-dependent alcohol dehydrogenase [Spirosoma validum]|uniref:Alcohol dehydrogenase catalytic domain-containing protein n=1 Tax=Spirosoma validum TaxID=2771355 RepID=A0A927B7G0_9BACT|nr:alcohol dehydrogenase catalytic domain-containing protein [Spirosoma validum]MBD2756688.1 alcohol dehydrogenase catalytic domain-containing protein [Spirosoma validum]